MIIKTIRAAVLAALFLSLTACIFLWDDPWNDGEGSTQVVFEKTLPWPEKGGLSVFHLDGDIEIRGWDRAEVEIVLEADRWIGRRGPFGGRSGRPRVETQTGTDGGLVLKTVWEGDERAVAPCHYFIRAPRSLDLRDVRTGRGSILIADLYGRAAVQIQSGDLKVENFSGALKAQVWRGRIEAELLDLRGEDEVDLTARAGDLTLYLEKDTAARVEAEASNGIASELDLRAPAGAKQISAALGQGGPLLRLKALAGRIALKTVR